MSVNEESTSDVAVKIPLVPLTTRPVPSTCLAVFAISNTGHRGYLWDPPRIPERRNGLGVGWRAEVDMGLLRVSFFG